MHIPVTLKVHSKDVPVKALIDSGAEGLFINRTLVRKLRLPTYRLDQPLLARNVDGSPIKGATITRKTTVPLHVGSKVKSFDFYVASIHHEDLILGYPWLQKHNPTIDWKSGSISVQKLSIGNSGQPNEPISLPANIPDDYKDFAKLFNKGSAERFPPSRPYDHAIDLKPDFKPTPCKIYLLSPNEQDELDKFIEENLAKGDPQGVVVAENGKVWMQARVVGGILVAGESVCIELQVKNHSTKKVKLSLHL